MDNRKTLFLDTSILLEIAKASDYGQEIRRFIEQNGFILVIGVMNLIEIQKWKQYWHSVAIFISSVPFLIAETPENITRAEVENYPNEISLPIALDSSIFAYSADQTAEALESNLSGKVTRLEGAYRNEYRAIWQSFIANRESPENGKSFSASEVETFFLINVLQWLHLAGYKSFLQNQVSASRIINLKRFKSIYLPLLGIFVEYSINNKTGHPSDVGDFYQLGILPYVSASVLDNERNSLIHYINRHDLFSQELSTYNQKEFRERMSSS
jgi:hypothetical protein